MILVPVANTAYIRRAPVVTLALIGATSVLWLATAFAPGPKSAVEHYDRVVVELERTYGLPYEDRRVFELRMARGLVLRRNSVEWRQWRDAFRASMAALSGLDEWLVQKLGFMPDHGFDHRLVTSLFLHGDFMHLFMNMLFLFLVGCNVEDQWGRWRFLLFYLVGGIAANLAHFAADPASDLPLVGASGAVAAVMAAFVVFHAWVRIRFFWWFILFGFFELPAVVAVGAWLVLQIVDAASARETAVAYWAHLGGFGFGLCVAVPVRLWRGPVPRGPRTLPRRDESTVALPGSGLAGDWLVDRALEAAEEQLRAGDPSGAATAFEAVLERAPAHLEARWGLVRARLALGDRSGAMRLGEGLIADLTKEGRVEEARRVYSTLMG